ncbi:MAG: methyltransferase domain-containing protein [Campylobacterales bacterium]|nr:methyltransferase domain-containing protein [Campylobacterales bacterium]
MHFTDHTMQEILAWIEQQEGEQMAFSVLDPDHARLYGGTPVDCEGVRYRYRSYRSLCDLAEAAHCVMRTPIKLDRCRVRITFERLRRAESFHIAPTESTQEKYGSASPYALIHKNEEPAFLDAYLRALRLTGITQRERILDLGINRGDEFEVIRREIGDEAFTCKEFVGIDHSASAIDAARSRFGSNVALHVSDINAIDDLHLEPFDLILSIGTLQSPSIPFKSFVMHLVQNYLTCKGALILGFPNCRWIDGEMIYGAKAPNYNFAEQSLLYGDVMFCKKYLQQHRFRVMLHGKHYLFLSAVKIG